MVKHLFITFLPLITATYHAGDVAYDIENRVKRDTVDIPIPAGEESAKHVVSLNKNLNEGETAALVNLVKQAEYLTDRRDFTNFVTMAFWAVTLDSVNPETNELYESIHEIPLEESTHFWKEQFTHYGCYCWPDGKEKISGFGPPQDALDEQCHDLWQCYRCINRDPACAHVDWVHDHYDCEFLKSSDNTTLTIDCTDPDPCLKSLCECDKQFAVNAKDAYLAIEDQSIYRHNNSTLADEFESHAEGQFDFDTCIPPGHQHDFEKGCCGDWPAVQSYDTSSKCCAPSTSDPFGPWKIHKLGDITFDPEHSGTCNEDIGTLPTIEQLHHTLPYIIESNGHDHSDPGMHGSGSSHTHVDMLMPVVP